MRLRTVFLASLLAAFLPAGKMSGQPQGEVIPLGRVIAMKSEILTEDREFLIYIPPGYVDGDSR